MSERLSRQILNDLGGTFALRHQARVQITHAQILAIVTTPVEILPPPGANRVLVSGLMTGGEASMIMASSFAAAYTNVDSNPRWRFRLGPTGPYGEWSCSSILQYASAPAMVAMGSGNYVGQGADFGDVVEFANMALTLKAINGALGSFTGGNAANVLTLNFDYMVLDVSIGRFV